SRPATLQRRNSGEIESKRRILDAWDYAPVSAPAAASAPLAYKIRYCPGLMGFWSKNGVNFAGRVLLIVITNHKTPSTSHILSYTNAAMPVIRSPITSL